MDQHLFASSLTNLKKSTSPLHAGNLSRLQPTPAPLPNSPKSLSHSSLTATGGTQFFHTTAVRLNQTVALLSFYYAKISIILFTLNTPFSQSWAEKKIDEESTRSVVTTTPETFTPTRKKTMTKERKSNREGKKKAALTPKEKKAAKKAKKEASASILKNGSM